MPIKEEEFEDEDENETSYVEVEEGSSNTTQSKFNIEVASNLK